MQGVAGVEGDLLALFILDGKDEKIGIGRSGGRSIVLGSCRDSCAPRPILPKGFGVIFPGLRYQRRLKTSSGSGWPAAPAAAGRRISCAFTMDSTIPSRSRWR